LNKVRERCGYSYHLQLKAENFSGLCTVGPHRRPFPVPLSPHYLPHDIRIHFATTFCIEVLIV
jgi:hypothetical protein